MKDIPMTEVIQSAYDKAQKDLNSGKLPISDIEDLCHVAFIYAINDLYQGSKKPNIKCHYDKPIKELYKLFDKAIISENDTYASFAFCYLKVFQVDKFMKKSSFIAQFEYEKAKYSKLTRP